MTLPKILSYAAYGFKTFILRKELPYLLIIVLTDKCNLNCFYCESKNSGKYHFTFPLAKETLLSAYSHGHRALVITGGEPTLWRDGGKGIQDLIELSRDIGFADIFVYTNGTNGFPSGRCKYIVTIDGTKKIHDEIRSGSYDQIIRNIKASKNPDIYATITITRHNVGHIEDIIDGIYRERIFKAISFNLLTHHKDIVLRHGFTGQERIAVLDKIWGIKKKGYPIVFSRAAYKAMRYNNWKRPITQIELATNNRLFKCCRDVVNPDICENCGYSSCVEVSQMLSLKPTALWEVFRMAG